MRLQILKLLEEHEGEMRLSNIASKLNIPPFTIKYHPIDSIYFYITVKVVCYNTVNIRVLWLYNDIFCIPFLKSK